MRTALVFTVRDEFAALPRLLAAVDTQTRRPDEVVAVDGGSTDGTWEMLRTWAAERPGATALQASGANISRGRNLAIESATAEVIAVTDGGARPVAGWFEALVAPFEDGAIDMAMGFYRGRATTTFERVVDCLNLPDVEEVDPERFLPSSRSVAFRRELWSRIGGYPEWLEIGEDMLFDLRAVDLGARRVFVPDALVEWDLRPGLASFLQQYFRYARGDGEAGMHPRRHALRFGTYGLAILLGIAAPRQPSLLLVPVAAGAAWLRPAYRRAWRRLGRDRTAAAVLIPPLTVAMDGAKMAGYLAGRLRQRRRQPSR